MILNFTGMHGRPDIVLRCRPSQVGGTGSHVWKEGALLAAWICRQPPWFFFNGHDVLELGAGSAGLPSQCVALCGAAPCNICVSDGISELCHSLRASLALNGLKDLVGV